MSKIDIMSLETDYTTVPGQIFACLSIIGPEAPQKNDKFGIKIRGAFATRDEASNHAKRLQKEDPTFDIYVVDMYRGILQHKVYVTSFYLKPYILERKLEVPLGMGRIYRIVNKAKGRNKTQPKLQNASVGELVKTLSHPNGWWRDTAQRLLVERREKKSIPALRKVRTTVRFRHPFAQHFLTCFFLLLFFSQPRKRSWLGGKSPGAVTRILNPKVLEPHAEPKLF